MTFRAFSFSVFCTFLYIKPKTFVRNNTKMLLLTDTLTVSVNTTLLMLIANLLFLVLVFVSFYSKIEDGEVLQVLCYVCFDVGVSGVVSESF